MWVSSLVTKLRVPRKTFRLEKEELRGQENLEKLPRWPKIKSAVSPQKFWDPLKSPGRLVYKEMVCQLESFEVLSLVCILYVHILVGNHKHI